jgi:hypothetical protein
MLVLILEASLSSTSTFEFMQPMVSVLYGNLSAANISRLHRFCLSSRKK